MFTKAASPEMVLLPGRTYTLPDKVAEPLLNGKMIHGITADGKPIIGGPYAIEVRGERGIAPLRPDPDEHKSDILDDDEDDDEDESQ